MEPTYVYLDEFGSFRIDSKQETTVYFVCAVSMVTTLTLTIGRANVLTVRFLQIPEGAVLHFAWVSLISGECPVMAIPRRTPQRHRGGELTARNGRLMVQTGLTVNSYIRLL